VLIRNDPPCRKCRETEAALESVVRDCGGTAEMVMLTVAEAQAAGYGVVLTPTVLVNGKVLCAGIVPRAAGVARVVAAEAQTT
jgi:hypothetical protein